MEFLVGAIVSFILEYLLRIPGAVIRWLYHLGNRNFKDIIKDEPEYNTFIGLGGLMILIVPVIIILNQ